MYDSIHSMIIRARYYTPDLANMNNSIGSLH